MMGTKKAMENHEQIASGSPMRFCPRCATALQKAVVDGKSLPRCPSCGFVAYSNPKLAVAVITEVDGKVLLARRSHEPGMGRWTFPSGYVDTGEKVEEAAVRETKEETSVDVCIDGLMGVYSEKGNPVVLIVYVGTIIGGEPHPGPEATEVGFFHPTELPEMAFEHDGALLQEWVKWIQNR